MGDASTPNTAGDAVLYEGQERRDGQRLRVSWRQYEGHHFVDVRLHYRAEGGEWRPGNRGVSVKLAELFGVADALNEACRLAEGVRR